MAYVRTREFRKVWERWGCVGNMRGTWGFSIRGLGFGGTPGLGFGV